MTIPNREAPLTGTDDMHDITDEVRGLIDVYRRWKLNPPPHDSCITTEQDAEMLEAWKTFINLFANSWGYYLEELFFDVEKDVYFLESGRTGWASREYV